MGGTFLSNYSLMLKNAEQPRIRNGGGLWLHRLSETDIGEVNVSKITSEREQTGSNVFYVKQI